MASLFIGASLIALAVFYGAVVIAAALSIGLVLGALLIASHWWGW